MGWSITGVSVIFFALHEIGRANGWPYSPAEAVAIAGLAALAIFVTVVARRLKKIEARLTELERDS